MCNQRTYLSNIVGQRADIILLSQVSLPNNVDVTALSVVRSQMSRARSSGHAAWRCFSLIPTSIINPLNELALSIARGYVNKNKRRVGMEKKRHI